MTSHMFGCFVQSVPIWLSRGADEASCTTVSFKLSNLGDPLEAKCVIRSAPAGLAELEQGINLACTGMTRVAENVAELTTLHGVMQCPESQTMSCFACPCTRSPCISQGMLISMTCTQGVLDKMFEGITWKPAAGSDFREAETPVKFLLKVCGPPWRSVAATECYKEALCTLLTDNATVIQSCLPLRGFVRVQSVAVIIMEQLDFVPATKESVLEDHENFARMMSSMIFNLARYNICHLDIRIPNFGVAGGTWRCLLYTSPSPRDRG
eukprot:4965387-Amphidinium_carterae.1